MMKTENIIVIGLITISITSLILGEMNIASVCIGGLVGYLVPKGGKND